MIYHVTPSENLQSILSEGLRPAIGERSQELGEAEARVYFFRNLEDVETALVNWMANAFDESDELVVIEIERDAETLGLLCDSEHDFEVTCAAVIPASCVHRILDENLEEIDNPRKKKSRLGA